MSRLSQSPTINIPQSTSLPMDTLRAKLQVRNNTNIQESVDHCRERLRLLQSERSEKNLRTKKTREEDELPRYVKTLDFVKDTKFITADEFFEHPPAENSRIVIVGSTKDAVRVLQSGPLRHFILVPAELNETDESPWTIEKHLDLIECNGGIVEYHDFFNLPDMKHGGLVSDLASNFRKTFQDPMRKVNLLGFKGSHHINTVGNKIFNSPEIRNKYNGLGLEYFTGSSELQRWLRLKKTPESMRNQITNSQFFRLLANTGVFSRAHIDRGGVETIITCQAGKKAWIAASSQTRDVIEKFAENYDSIESSTEESRLVFGDIMMGIYLEENDTLIQPSATIHAPYTIEHCSIVGGMVIDHRKLPDQIWQTKSECLKPHITNEDVAPEFAEKMMALLHHWSRNLDSDNFPPRRLFQDALRDFQREYACLPANVWNVGLIVIGDVKVPARGNWSTYLDSVVHEQSTIATVFTVELASIVCARQVAVGRLGITATPMTIRTCKLMESLRVEQSRWKNALDKWEETTFPRGGSVALLSLIISRDIESPDDQTLTGPGPTVTGESLIVDVQRLDKQELDYIFVECWSIVLTTPNRGD
ncbi:hypothetical protein BT63DRAFT_409924 [Microthyrium microscopicum]|uniref:JmjC domain-containing protein n=1 Tax=Microthyrium microscopicum TaxID=703497 RepID=A0A6A6UKQ3_9PEZI|nr:hypothetical protein BT63DRAFT_409924 [Microthyrium microscopicum]